LHGVEDLGLGVASATASVVNPGNAADDDLESEALIVRGAAVLNAATVTPVFKHQLMPTVSLQIIMTDLSNTFLNLSLLDGFAIQRYLGANSVGEPVDNGSGFLGLKLLSFGADKNKLNVSAFAEAYDRVKISYGGVAE